MTDVDRTFDRIPQFDERSRAFPIRAVVAEQPLVTQIWAVGTHLDQGSEGACVGFGWSAELAAEPVAVPDIDDPYAFDLYRDAQQRDEWPGEEYSGSSVLGGAKAVHARGLIGSYRWCFGLDDALLALSYAGPVVLGVNWYDGMLEADENGLIRPTGQVRGGHAILAYAIDVDAGTVWLRNSWGPAWGRNGDGHLTWDDLAHLLGEEGEACVPQERAAGPVQALEP